MKKKLLFITILLLASVKTVCAVAVYHSLDFIGASSRTYEQGGFKFTYSNGYVIAIGNDMGCAIGDGNTDIGCDSSVDLMFYPNEGYRVSYTIDGANVGDATSYRVHFPRTGVLNVNVNFIQNEVVITPPAPEVNTTPQPQPQAPVTNNNTTSNQDSNKTPTPSTSDQAPTDYKYINTFTHNNVEFTSVNELNATYELKVEELDKKNIQEVLGDNEVLLYYDIKMNDEKNNQVELKDGKFTIKIKVDETLKDKNNLKVLYILNNEVKEKLDCKVEEDYLIFETTHLSEYAVVEENDKIVVKVPPVKVKNNSSNTIIYIVGCILAVITIACGAFITVRKKKLKK